LLIALRAAGAANAAFDGHIADGDAPRIRDLKLVQQREKCFSRSRSARSAPRLRRVLRMVKCHAARDWNYRIYQFFNAIIT